MSTVLLLARTLLAVVFLTAGVTKLAKPAQTRAMLLAFGVPRGGSPILARLLPLAELACGVALVPAATARWGTAAALVLLVVFLAAIAWNLIRGRRPDCRCFGRLRSAPIGWQVVIRNLGLIVVASFVWLSAGREGDLGLIEWARRLSGMEVMTLAIGAVAGLVLAGQAWLIAHLLRQNGRLIHRLDALEAGLPEPRTALAATESEPQFGLALGQEAPAFAGPDLNGVTVSLSDFRELGKPVLLFFMDPGCGPCATLRPEIARWRRAHEDEVTIAAVSRGLAEANREWFSQDEWAAVVLQADDEIGQLYQALGTPSAVLVDRQGRIASPVAQGAGAIQRLVTRTLRTRPERSGRTTAAPATATAGMALLTILLLGAARHPGDRPAQLPRADWVLQVRDSRGWQTWWDGDSAPTRWPVPMQAVLDAIWWTPLVQGADHGELVVSSGSLALRTRIVLARFDSRRYRIRIAGQPTQPGMRASWTIDAADEDAVLAFNGGQFSKLGAWGWLVREGREIQPPGWGPLSMAVVLTWNGDTHFALPDEVAGFRSSERVQEAFQSYPALLVGDGDVPVRLRRPGGSVDLEHRDARLALCSLRDGRLLVALTRFDNLGRVFGGLPIGLTLGEMAAVMGAIGCRQAVSLDGGLSAQLLARPGDGPVARWTGQRAVPLGIEVVPRP